MHSLLRIPVADVLLLDLSGKFPDVSTSGDPFTPLHVLHGEKRVMFHAHVVETKVHRGAIRRGRQHRLGHDAWDVQLLLRCFLESFRFVCASLFALILLFVNIQSSFRAVANSLSSIPPRLLLVLHGILITLEVRGEASLSPRLLPRSFC